MVMMVVGVPWMVMEAEVVLPLKVSLEAAAPMKQEVVVAQMEHLRSKSLAHLNHQLREFHFSWH